MVKEYVVNIWETQEFMVITHPSLNWLSGGYDWVCGMVMCKGGEPDTDKFYICVNEMMLCLWNRCVVDGTCAMAVN